MDAAQVHAKLAHKFGAEAVAVGEYAGMTRLTVARDQVYDVLETLRNDPELKFEMLVDLHGQDYLHYEGMRDRFAVVYQVLSLEHNLRVWVRVLLNEPDLEVKSVVPLWAGANWMEREVYDMFGITFAGHPNLCRVLMPDDFQDHPLRKDYPMRGKGERHSFQALSRDES